MKKVHYYVLTIALIIALTVMYHLYMRPMVFFEKETGIKLPLAAKTIANNKDIGFGDGTLLYVYQLDKNQIDKLLKDNQARLSGWGQMPMDSALFIELDQILSGVMDKNEMQLLHLGASQGYFIIKDHNRNGFSSNNIENQPSTNIEIILIDLSWNRIVYFSMDT